MRSLQHWNGGSIPYLVLLLGTAVGLVGCGDDPTAPSGGGTLDFKLSFEDGLHLSGASDSLRFWVRDSNGRVLAGPDVIEYDGGAFELDLRVPQGDDHIVQVRLETDGFRGRGAEGWGEAREISVDAARTTDVSLGLVGVVPDLYPVSAMPGDLSYRVSWTPEPEADTYELLEFRDEVETVYALSDTAFTVSLTDSEEAVDLVTYRVRSLGAYGTSIYGDPITFRPEEIRDVPSIVAVDPPDGSSEVRDDFSPTVTFDRPMDWASLDSKSVTLVDVDSELPFTALADGTNATLTLTHFEPFLRGHRYRLTVAPGLLGADGRLFDQDPDVEGLQGFSSEFTVEVYDPLRIVGTAPIDGGEAVSIETSVELDLNRDFDPVTATGDAVRVRDASGDPVVGALTLMATRILFAPDEPLAYDAIYFVEVTTSLLDLRGEPLDQDPDTPIPAFEPFSSSFRTEPQPIGARVVRVAPLDGEENWPVFADIEVEFDRPIDAATILPQGSFNLRKLPVGASVPGVLLSSGDRQTFTFAPANNLEQGTRYQIDLTTGILDDNGVPIDQEPKVPGFQGFKAEFDAEENLRVTRITPPDRQTRIPPDIEIEVEFNLPADVAQLGAESVTLERGGAPVAINRSLSPDGRIATLWADTPLDLFVEYTVRINQNLWTRAGSRFDQDLSEDGYQEFLSHFTTRPESIPPMVVGVTPEDMATAVERRPELAVSFSKPIQPGSFNSSTVFLREAGGEIVATALSVAADSLRGSLALVADLDFDTEYHIEVTNWIVDQFDVRLDQDPTQPDRQGFESSFRTDVERVPPWVIAVRPSRGTVDVPLETTIELDFSETMDPASLSAGVQLEQDGVPVDGVVIPFSDNNSARFVPNAPLLENRAYQVTVTEAATDVVGNPLDDDPDTPELDPFLSDFVTEIDRLGPFALSLDPADGSVGVEPSVRPRLVFSEAIDTTTVEDGISLRDSTGTPVFLQDVEIVALSEVRIVPAVELEPLHRYEVVVTSALRDTVQNEFDQDPGTPENEEFSSFFSTDQERTPPRALGAFFDDQPPPQTTLIRVAFSEAIDSTSLDVGDVVLRTRDQGAEVSVLLTLVAPDTLYVRPVDQLLASTGYELVVEGLLDLLGNPFDQDAETPELDPFIKLFTTARDTRSPAVLESFPVDGESGVLSDAVVSLLFDEPMDPSSFSELFYRVIRLEGSQEFPASGEITWDDAQRRFFFTPENTLLRGFYYLIRADFHLEDLAGNPLDQDRSTSVEDPFIAQFLVGEFPVADAGAPLCSAESTLVTVDGSASFDPDGVIARAIWQWGDGSPDTELNSPEPGDLIVQHEYSCHDVAGCDGIDNDNDGLVDELDCDESYRIILRIIDEDGLSSTDTTGVSFCGFGILTTDPADEATEVDTLLAEVSIDFTQSIADTSLNETHFSLREIGGLGPVEIDTIRIGPDPSVVVLELADPLSPGAVFELLVDAPHDDQGRPFDADPCTPETDPYVSRFTTRAAMQPRRSDLEH